MSEDMERLYEPLTDPVMLPPKKWQPAGKSFPRRHAGNGVKKRAPQPARPPAMREAAQAATAANKMVLWLQEGRHRTWVRQAYLTESLGNRK
jgi:hypothetical protein